MASVTEATTLYKEASDDSDPIEELAADSIVELEDTRRLPKQNEPLDD